MRKRKAVIGCLMAVVMGICAVAGNVSADEVAAERGPEEIKIASIHNPIVDASTEAVTFSYVYFGNYPQSEVTGDALTEEIIEAYYDSSGIISEITDIDGIINYAVSGEAVVMGEKYRRMAGEDGGYRYFKYEPIKWRVINISENQVVLRTDKILDYKAYNVMDYAIVDVEWGRWNGTSLQYWLNGYGTNTDGFLQQAFTEVEMEGILDKEIKDKIRNSYSFIKDKVFILSAWEWMCYDIVMESKAGITEKTGYANLLSPISGEKYGSWWFRNDEDVQYVGYAEYMNERGEWCYRFIDDHTDSMDFEHYQAHVSNAEIGVCPSIILDLTRTDLWKTEEEFKKEHEQKPEKSEIPSTEPMIPYLTGDVNQDGQVTLIDAQLTLKAALKIEILTEEQTTCADMNKDGEVTHGDAQKILKIALKIIG